MSVSANITPRGLADWSAGEIKEMITNGVSRDGRRLMPPMAFGTYKNITDADLDAIIAYLRTIPAKWILACRAGNAFV